jgi:serine/threonine protein kinase
VARALDETPLDGDESPSGTIYAMSPEQILKPDEAAPHWDLWGLAVLAYTALKGRPPFEGKSMIGVLGAALHGLRESIDGARMTLGAKVDAVFARAFSIALSERYATATEFAEALAAALGPYLDEADVILDAIAAAMNDHDEVTAVRRRAEMTTRVNRCPEGRATRDARRQSWMNEKDSALSTSTFKRFDAARAPMWRTAPSPLPIAATAGR